jgi:hypothetical protein
VSLQRTSPPLQSALVGRFDQIEAVGVVNLDVPVEGKLKQRSRYANCSALFSCGSSHFMSAPSISATLAADRKKHWQRTKQWDSGLDSAPDVSKEATPLGSQGENRSRCPRTEWRCRIRSGAYR